MALIKRDTINPNKMEQVTPSQGLEEALRVASLGCGSREENNNEELQKLKEVVGRLLDTLREKEPSLGPLLNDYDIARILKCHTITVGSYVGETPQG